MLTARATNTNHEVVNTFSGATFHDIKAEVRETYPSPCLKAQVQIAVIDSKGHLVCMKPMFMQAFYSLDHML